MTDTTAPIELENADGAAAVEGGGPAERTGPQDPMAQVVAHLELLSAPAREAVLERMDAGMAEVIRSRLDSRPHGEFSHDVVSRRRMMRELSERIHAQNAAKQEERVENALPAAAQPMPVQLHGAGTTPAPVAAAPSASPAAVDPLDSLSTLHPAAIARAMQGERAEAWAIVLDHLSVEARAALQTYLQPEARVAIDEARSRQEELARSSPQLSQTIEAAIAKTVVPRAMREHHHLLSTTPLSWNGA